MDADPFRTLGVSETASESELRAAFRKLVHALHPDRQAGDPRATERLRAVVDAYESACARRHGRRPTRRRASTCDTAPRERLRYACDRCDDTFAFEGECPRCDALLRDAWLDATPRYADPESNARVAAFIAALETRGEPQPSLLDTHGPALTMGGLALGGLLAFGVYAPVGVMCLGYALFLAGVFTHARRSEEALRAAVPTEPHDAQPA